MADKVIYQDDDDLSETNLALMLAVGNQTDYTERGFGFSPDFQASDLTIGTSDMWGNFAIIEDSKKAYYLFADQRTVSLAESNGQNYVHLHHDPTQDDHIDIHVDGDQTPPAGNPSLLIGTVDTSNQTFNDTINDDPDGVFEAATLTDRSSQPSAPSDARILYAKDSDGNIYKVNPDGSEEQIGGGGGVWSDDDSDGLYEQDQDGIAVPTLSAGVATIGGHEGVGGIEGGTVVLDLPTSSDATTDTRETDAEEVTFSTEFDSRPKVLTTGIDGQQYFDTGAYNVSETGCNIFAFNDTTSSNTITVDWVAIELN